MKYSNRARNVAGTTQCVHRLEFISESTSLGQSGRIFIDEASKYRMPEALKSIRVVRNSACAQQALKFRPESSKHRDSATAISQGQRSMIETDAPMLRAARSSAPDRWQHWLVLLRDEFAIRGVVQRRGSTGGSPRPARGRGADSPAPFGASPREYLTARAGYRAVLVSDMHDSQSYQAGSSLSLSHVRSSFTFQVFSNWRNRHHAARTRRLTERCGASIAAGLWDCARQLRAGRTPRPAGPRDRGSGNTSNAYAQIGLSEGDTQALRLVTLARGALNLRTLSLHQVLLREGTLILL
eukprot:675144-Pleurochrysis_carterae.AAC.5